MKDSPSFSPFIRSRMHHALLGLGCIHFQLFCAKEGDADATHHFSGS